MNTPLIVSIEGLRPIQYKAITPVPVIVEEMLVHLAARGRSVRHVETVRCLLRRFAAWWPGPVGQLAADDISRFLDSLLPLAPRTLNNHLVMLRSFVNFAKKRRYLPGWWDELDTLDLFTVPPSPTEIYTPAELAALLRCCSPAFRAGLVLVALAGVRQAEMLRLPWAAVKFDRGGVEVEAGKAKTRQRRICPLSANAAAWLAPLAPVNPPAPIYGGLRCSFCEGIERAHRRAGVTPRRNGLRHSFVSYRLALVQSVDAVALEAGNTPGMVFRHYRELVTPEAGREWFNIFPEDGQMELKMAV